MKKTITLLPLLGVLIAGPLMAALDLDKTGGSLGAHLKLSLSGDKNEAFVVIPSTNAGPTKLSMFSPGDWRKLSIGLDALTLAQAGTLNSYGKSTVIYPLPGVSALHGLTLHWQAITVPGKRFLVDDISNKILTVFGVKNAFAKLPRTMPISVAYAGKAMLNNGKVFIAGGVTGKLKGTLFSGKSLKESFLFDPKTYTWTRGPNMSTERGAAVTVKLNDGRILVAGGSTSKGTVLKSCEIYDPRTNKWTATGNMNKQRVGHMGTLLPNGKVLVCGGAENVTDLITILKKGLMSSAELYDPRTGRWSYTGSMKKPRIGFSLSRTGSRVVVAGGLSLYKFLGIPIPEFTKTAEYYNYSNGRWYYTGSYPFKHAGQNSITLHDGRVLVCGGVYSSNILNENSYYPINYAALYTPSSNSWRKMYMRSKRGFPSLLVRPDHKVLIVGGAAGTATKPVALNTCEVFSPYSFSWNSNKLNTGRAASVVVRLPEGNYLIAGGAGGSTNSTLTSCEIFLP